MAVEFRHETLGMLLENRTELSKQIAVYALESQECETLLDFAFHSH